MSVYDSLPSYKEVKISTGIVRVKKLTLGEFIEFQAHIRQAAIYSVLKAEKEEMDCLTAACAIACETPWEGTIVGSTTTDTSASHPLREDRLGASDIRTIIEQVKNLNGFRSCPSVDSRDSSHPASRDEDTDPTTGKRDADWLQKLFARCMRDLKLSKHEALEMYPAEIGAILEENRKLARIEKLEGALCISGAKYDPERIGAELMELQGVDGSKEKISAEEEKRLNEKYGDPNYGVRSPSVESSPRANRSATAPKTEGDK